MKDMIEILKEENEALVIELFPEYFEEEEESKDSSNE